LTILTLVTVRLEQLDKESAGLAKKLAKHRAERLEETPSTKKAEGATANSDPPARQGSGFWSAVFGSGNDADETDFDGLVLLGDTVEGRRGSFATTVTGIVENRRETKLSYAQISFNLYDSDGNQVGTALANVTGLAAGGRWKFEATGLADDVSAYKIDELTGY
jgi:hypothetical protein